MSYKTLLLILSISTIASCSVKELDASKIVEIDGLQYAISEDPFDGVQKDYYPNKQLKSEINYKDGQKHGLHKEFEEDGKPVKKINYKNGQKHKRYEEFNNGIIIVSANYKDGSQDGRYEAFHENGELKLKTTYKDGKENGKYEAFHENGELKLKTRYKDGKENGKYEAFHENGKLKLTANYKDGKKDGLAEQFFTNGKIEFIENYKDGEKEGIHEIYSLETGNIQKRANYKKGVLHGLYEYFTEDGLVYLKENYSSGDMNYNIYNLPICSDQGQESWNIDTSKWDNCYGGYGFDAFFEGRYEDGKRSGYGSITYEESGYSKIGEWEDYQLKDGIGFASGQGQVYKGEFKNGLYNGKGSLKQTAGEFCNEGYCDILEGWEYNGYFLNGNRHGEGTITYDNGVIEKGTFNENTLVVSN